MVIVCQWTEQSRAENRSMCENKGIARNQWPVRSNVAQAIITGNESRYE